LQHWLDICGGSQIISIRRPYKIFAGLFIGSPLFGLISGVDIPFACLASRFQAIPNLKMR
jgi:hypothetical protein